MEPLYHDFMMRVKDQPAFDERAIAVLWIVENNGGGRVDLTAERDEGGFWILVFF